MSSYNNILTKCIRKYNNFLFEGIEEVKKQFPKLDNETFNQLIKLDPTYKGGNVLGNYGKWILQLYYNNVKNVEMKRNYEDFMSKNPDGINHNNGQRIQAPKMLPSVSQEDLYKIPALLKQYQTLYKEIKQPINNFKTLPELSAAINNVQQQGIPIDETALRRYNLIKKAMQKGFKKIYEDNKWIVGIPTTKESSCMFGEDTSWCTTTNGQEYYERYTKDGPLYINLNKSNGALYQFHYESNQYMDEDDRSVDIMDDVFSGKDDKEVINFYLNKIGSELTPEVIVERIKKDINGEIVSQSDDSVIVRTPLDELDGVVGSNARSNRNGLSFETIEKILRGDGWDVFDGYGYDTRLKDLYSGYTDKFDKAMKENGINLDWDSDIDKIYEDYFDNEDEKLSDAQLTKLKYVLSEDFGFTGMNVQSVISNCQINGSVNDAEKDIQSDLISEINSLKKIELGEDRPLIFEFPMLKVRAYYVFLPNDYSNIIKYMEQIGDYDNPKTIDEPYNGWDGFDEKDWEEHLDGFIKQVLEIMK